MKQTSTKTPSDIHWTGKLGWILLDWAASAFSTISITLLVAYIEKVVFLDSPSEVSWGLPGGVIWAWTLAASMLASAIAIPSMASWADRHQAQRRALAASVLTGSLSCMLLGCVPTSEPAVIIFLVALATTAFDLAAVFTGSILPQIATGSDADKLSASGFAAGYAGGATALILATWIVSNREQFNLDMPRSLQIAFLLTGGWWFIFSLPGLLIRTRAPRSFSLEPNTAAHQSFLVSYRELFRFQKLIPFIIAAVLILGAVQTTISQLSSIAMEEFALQPQDLVRLVLLVQAVALPGALLVGWFSTRCGRKAALTACLIGWTLVLVAAVIVQNVSQLYGVAIILALVLGGIQSVIRAHLASLAPLQHSAAAFGLMQVGAKLTGCIASLLFGVVYAATNHPRFGVIVLLVQLLLGWWWLARRCNPCEIPLESTSGSSKGF